MIVGIPREIKPQEFRTPLPPSGAFQLVRHGHTVVIETGAGVGAGFSDEEYRAAGAEIVTSAAEVFARATLLLKVKEPQPQEIPLLQPHHILFTYLHLAASKELTLALLQSGATAIAYETVQRQGRLPLLEPMSEIAGRMSVTVGAHLLARHAGGGGILLGGVPGVLPGRVVVLGGGTAGVNAARIATALGADVTILEVDLERMRFLDITLHTAHTLYSNESGLLDLLPQTDLLIGAVLVPGARAPRLIRRDMLRLMKPGSVFVDLAVDQGGCAETSRPTTHQNPAFIEEGVLHYCVANMPGAYPRTASQALANATFPYVETLATEGIPNTIRRFPGFEHGIALSGGQLHCQAVAAAHNLPCTPFPAPSHA